MQLLVNLKFNNYDPTSKSATASTTTLMTTSPITITAATPSNPPNVIAVPDETCQAEKV